jgi:uncharacterized protein YbjT (DUF2867 family)
MNYVITGSAGHISKPLAEKLLSQGHNVTVVSRNKQSLTDLIAKGAVPAIGSVEDVAFLTKTFQGADAVYTMVPPNMAVTEWKNFIEKIGKNYANAIKASGVKYVVNLSSLGAHLPEGVGPVSGLYRVENALNTLTDVNIRHLRPGYFYPNLFAQLSLIKKLGITGGNFGGNENKLVLSDPADIAEAAAQELLDLRFSGHSVRYLASDEKTPEEIAKILGTQIGKPELPWVVFTDEQATSGAVQAGLSEEIATNYAEMGNAIRTGKMTEDYFKHRPATLGKIKLQDFAKIFAAVYNNEKELVAAH